MLYHLLLYYLFESFWLVANPRFPQNTVEYIGIVDEFEHNQFLLFVILVTLVCHQFINPH
jgi:hypothetical protein